MNPISKPKPVEGGETMNIKTEKMSKPKNKPDKFRIMVVKGPMFEKVIKEAQQYVLRLSIKKMAEAEQEVMGGSTN